MAKGLPSVIIGCFIAYVNIDSDLEIMIKQYIDAFLRVFGLQRIETETPISLPKKKTDNLIVWVISSIGRVFPLHGKC